MAACTHAIGTADTGATPNTSGAFTPAVGDLLIAFVVASDTSQATATLTSSIGGFTFTQFLRATYRTSLDSIYGFVANALVSSATSQTVAFDTASDAATGTVIFVCRVSGMTKTGLTAIRQSAKQDNQASAGTPAPAFSVAALTGNPCLGAIGNSSAVPNFTAPSGWTEGNETGYSTPNTGGEYVFRNSGFTGTTVTWGSASASTFGSMIVELDATAATPFTQNLGGTITPAGANVKAVTQRKTSGITPTGLNVRAIIKQLASGLTPSGLLRKATAKTFGGSITPTATLQPTFVYVRTLAGSVTPAGAIDKDIAQSKAGMVTPAGVPAKAINTTKGGSLTPSGLLATLKLFTAFLAGSLASSGALIKSSAKAAIGSINPSGAINKLITLLRQGTVTSSGTFQANGTNTLSVSGSITPTGTARKDVAANRTGALQPGGQATRAASIRKAGAMTPSGTLATLKLFTHSLAGSVASAGTVVRTAARSLAGTIAPAGSMIKTIGHFLSGLLTPIGTAISEMLGAFVAGKVVTSISSHTQLRADPLRFVTVSLSPATRMRAELLPVLAVQVFQITEVED